MQIFSAQLIHIKNWNTYVDTVKLCFSCVDIMHLIMCSLTIPCYIWAINAHSRDCMALKARNLDSHINYNFHFKLSKSRSGYVFAVQKMHITKFLCWSPIFNVYGNVLQHRTALLGSTWQIFLQAKYRQNFRHLSCSTWFVIGTKIIVGSETVLNFNLH